MNCSNTDGSKPDAPEPRNPLGFPTKASIKIPNMPPTPCTGNTSSESSILKYPLII